jgi:hypothetical protein
MAHSTHIYRHDLLQVHGEMATLSGTMLPGTIVPNRLALTENDMVVLELGG